MPAVYVVLVSAVTIIGYFFLSTMLPILSYMVPYYKIKRLSILEIKYRLIINFVVFLFLLLINVKMLIIYIIFPFLTETLFYLTERFKHKMYVFDRIVIMSIISTLLIFLIVYLNKDFLLKIMNETLTLNADKFNDIAGEIRNSMKFLRINFLSFLFSYLYLGNIILFIFLNKVPYNKWRISCYWIIPFIVIVFFEKIYGISKENKFLIENIFDIIKYIYIWYGIKTLYTILGIFKIRFSIFKHVISIFLALTYPLAAFIIGVIASFDVVEVKEIKI